MGYKKSVDRGWRREIVVSRHFEGPTDITLGGHVAGIMSVHVDSDTVEVSLRGPTPMEKPLILGTTAPDVVRLYDGETLLNEARPGELALEVPDPITYEQARKAALRDTVTPFENCFGCGSGRRLDNGLHLRAGPVEGRDVAAIDWTPPAAATGAPDGKPVPELMTLTAMECPIARAMDIGPLRTPEDTVVLGRMTTKLIDLPVVGGEYYFMAWPIERVDRRIEIAGLLNDRDGKTLAMTRQTFIALREGASLGDTSGGG